MKVYVGSVYHRNLLTFTLNLLSKIKLSLYDHFMSNNNNNKNFFIFDKLTEIVLHL